MQAMPQTVVIKLCRERRTTCRPARWIAGGRAAVVGHRAAGAIGGDKVKATAADRGRGWYIW